MSSNSWGGDNLSGGGSGTVGFGDCRYHNIFSKVNSRMNRMNLVACLLPEYSIVFQGYCTECRHRVVDNVIVCANNIVFLSRPIQWTQTLTRYQWIESLLSREQTFCFLECLLGTNEDVLFSCLLLAVVHAHHLDIKWHRVHHVSKLSNIFFVDLQTHTLCLTC